MVPSSRVQILGIPFYVGTAEGAVAELTSSGGYVIVPAAPALVRLEEDEIYRNAVAHADIAIPDSGLMVLLWRARRGQSIPRISGLAYLKALFADPSFRAANFYVLPSKSARDKLLEWARQNDRTIDDKSCYVAPFYGPAVEDPELLVRLNAQRPRHIVVAIGNGPQEKLGYYLRENLCAGPASARPAIHCIGAALGFITGDQVAIPNWADRFYLGWLLRLLSNPRVFVPRLARALRLPWLVFRYAEAMPPLREN